MHTFSEHMLRCYCKSSRQNIHAKTEIELKYCFSLSPCINPTGGETRTSLNRDSNTVRTLYITWSTLTFSPCLIRFVPESLETMHEPTSPVLLAARARTYTEPSNVTRMWPGDRVSIPGSLAYRAELRSHFVDRLHMYMLAFPLFIKKRSKFLALNKHKLDSLKRIK